MSNIISLLFNTTVLMKYFRSVIIQAKVAFIKSQYTVYRVIFIHFYFCPFSFANGLAPILEIAQTQSCLKSDKKQGQNKTGANTSTSLHVYSIQVHDTSIIIFSYFSKYVLASIRLKCFRGSRKFQGDPRHNFGNFMM